MRINLDGMVLSGVCKKLRFSGTEQNKQNSSRFVKANQHLIKCENGNNSIKMSSDSGADDWINKLKEKATQFLEEWDEAKEQLKLAQEKCSEKQKQ